MKKTLFAVAALALCGTAFAGEYNASDYEGRVFNDLGVFGEGNDVVLNVDKPVTLNELNLNYASSATLNFVGASTLSGDIVHLNVDNGDGTLAITGDPTAKTYWGESLTSSAGNITTLMLASATTDLWAPSSATFEGLTGSGPITLGDATLTYMGYYMVDTAAEGEAVITGDNQIALVAIDTERLYLVGKVGSTPAPEPATATLSLLALAGMAARRRRK